MGHTNSINHEDIEYFYALKENVNSSNSEQDELLIDNARSVADELGPLGDNNIEQYSQRFWGRSHFDVDAEVQKLLERNRRAEPEFLELMNNLQQELGGKLYTRERMKTPERIVIKANRAFGGDISKVGDVLAATLVYNTEDELLDAMAKLRQNDNVVHFVNRWTKPKRSTGYRDVEAHLALSDGTIVELQLNLRMMQLAKHNSGHALYEFMTNNDKYGELRDYIWHACELSKRLYDAALDGSYRRLKCRENR